MPNPAAPAEAGFLFLPNESRDSKQEHYRSMIALSIGIMIALSAAMLSEYWCDIFATGDTAAFNLAELSGETRERGGR